MSVDAGGDRELPGWKVARMRNVVEAVRTVRPKKACTAVGEPGGDEGFFWNLGGVLSRRRSEANLRKTSKRAVQRRFV